MPDLAPHPARLPFRVHFELAERVELFAATPDEARRKAMAKFPPRLAGRITKVKRVKDQAHG